MTSIYILFIFLAYLFGAVLLILTTGYKGLDAASWEQDAATLPPAGIAGAAALGPGFLSGTHAPELVLVAMDASLLRQLQRYVDEEKELVATFVSHPSPETLCRSSLRAMQVN